MNNQNDENLQKKNKGGIYAIIAIILVAVIALGAWGIAAYLTATDSAENVFTVGNVSIRLLEPSWNENNATDLVANQELAKDPKIQNNGANDAFVYLKLTMPKAVIRRNSTTKQELFTVSYNGQDGINNTDWDLLSETEAADGDSIVRVYYYKPNNGILAKNTTSNELFDTIKLANITEGANLEGRTINVQIDAYAIQSNSIDMPSSATTTKLKANYAWEKYWAQDEELNKVTVTFYDDDGITIIGTSQITKGSNATAPADPSKAATSEYTYEFAGWYTRNDAQGVVANLNNITENTVFYARYTATAVPQGTTIGGRTVSEIIEQDGYAGLYGTQVRYQGKTFRVFYVEDSSNKFGEGEGTIYLKADQITTLALDSVYSNYKSSSTKIRTVNPEWAEARGNVAESSWQVNEKAAAYLCDPTVETWSTYIDQTDENVNWVIGAPSAEMYMKSYAQSHSSSAANYAAKYFNQQSGVADVNGYKYTTDGNSYGYYTSDNSIADDNVMYRVSSTTGNGTEQYWWLASPSAASAYSVCRVYGDSGYVDGYSVYGTIGVGPLVSLRSGVTLELAQ